MGLRWPPSCAEDKISNSSSQTATPPGSATYQSPRWKTLSFCADRSETMATLRCATPERALSLWLSAETPETLPPAAIAALAAAPARPPHQPRRMTSCPPAERSLANAAAASSYSRGTGPQVPSSASKAQVAGSVALAPSNDVGAAPHSADAIVAAWASWGGGTRTARRSNSTSKASTVSATTSASSASGGAKPSRTAVWRSSSNGVYMPSMFTTPTGFLWRPAQVHSRASSSSSNVPMPPGSPTKASPSSSIKRFRCRMFSTTSSLVRPRCSRSKSFMKRGMTPTTLPPAASAASASTPIKPTHPPP
mmetsp:Transcript_87187/g.244655  ORF Transcript_87187/g.244655 Transcript_87187/m.244655 type:complete len:308 (+) Transcript_87187:263-1186(+)